MNIKVTPEILKRLDAGTWLYTSGGGAFGVVERFCATQRGSGGHEVRENVGGIDCGKLPRGGPGQGGATKRFNEAALNTYRNVASGKIEVYITPIVALRLAIMTPAKCEECGGSGTTEKNGYNCNCTACAGSGVVPSKASNVFTMTRRSSLRMDRYEDEMEFRRR